MPDNSRPRMQPIEWRGGVVRFIDQSLLPATTRYVETRHHRDVASAIAKLQIRGAPLIGIAGAYGLALAIREGVDARMAAAYLTSVRPTAVNLPWAVNRVLAAAQSSADALCAATNEACSIHQEQIDADARIGEIGAALIQDGATVLTHCNTGTLATGGIGTALGVIKTAHWKGKRLRVLVDETRPLLQGARLTAWELAQEGIPHTLIVDAAAPSLIASGAVGAVIVGADRIVANGDVANKIGTYGLALSCAANGVPFYVAAPVSTIDLATPDGTAITIEQRDPDEVRSIVGARIASDETEALNPAFDVTPASLVAAIISERGLLRPPFDREIREALSMQAAAAR